MDLQDYLNKYKNLVDSDNSIAKIEKSVELLKDLKKSKGKVILCGNGASASISSHGAVDLTKQARVRSIDFNEPNLLTAFGNDYGFENVFKKAFEFYSDKGDILICISVSGESPNIINVAEYAKNHGHTVITLSGKNKSNRLRGIGDINFWVDSSGYNIVECTHMIWLTSIVDKLIGKAEYDVS